jgi:hypothetical protein
MSLTSPDFESGAYTNFATPAARGKDNKATALGIATGASSKTVFSRPSSIVAFHYLATIDTALLSAVCSPFVSGSWPL